MYSLQTGITRSRKYVIRSQAVSADTRPARVSGGSALASVNFQVLYCEPPRPGVDWVRNTPSRLMLYLKAGMPALRNARS